jgi:hypothetical protein
MKRKGTKQISRELDRFTIKVFNRCNNSCAKCGRSDLNAKLKIYSIHENVLLDNLLIDRSIEEYDPLEFRTLCLQCHYLDDIENFDVIDIKCPVHGEDGDACLSAPGNHYETVFDYTVQFRMNGYRVSDLRKLALAMNIPARELLQEAIDDLVNKHWDKYPKGCKHQLK